MPFFESFDQQKIYYQHHHQPKTPKKTLIFVHGLGGTPSFLRLLIKAIATQLHYLEVISYHLRGHGKSTAQFPDNTDTFEQVHARDLASLCQHLDRKNYVLVGHSFGGMIIQELLNLNLDQNIKQIFFVVTVLELQGIRQFRQFFYYLLKKINRLHAPKTRVRPTQDFLQFKNQPDLNPKRSFYDSQMVGGLIRWVLTLLCICGWKNKTPQNINQPNYYYIYGKKDFFVPLRRQKKFLKLLPKIQKIEIDSNHICPLSSSEELAQIIIERL